MNDGKRSYKGVFFVLFFGSSAMARQGHSLIPSLPTLCLIIQSLFGVQPSRPTSYSSFVRFVVIRSIHSKSGSSRYDPLLRRSTQGRFFNEQLETPPLEFWNTERYRGKVRGYVFLGGKVKRGPVLLACKWKRWRFEAKVVVGKAFVPEKNRAGKGWWGWNHFAKPPNPQTPQSRSFKILRFEPHHLSFIVHIVLERPAVVG